MKDLYAALNGLMAANNPYMWDLLYKARKLPSEGLRSYLKEIGDLVVELVMRNVQGLGF